jgi:transposase
MREEFRRDAEQWDPATLVFLDEAGLRIGARLPRGRAPRGERLVSTGPVHRGENVSIVGALSFDGALEVTPWYGSMDGVGFLTWVEAVLVPRLRPGMRVVLDNVSFHKNVRVRELIEAAGAILVFLPPYSPDFNPIEECWSKVKHLIRKAAASGRAQVCEALAAAAAAVTSEDAAGWFRHAGYGTST